MMRRRVLIDGYFFGKPYGFGRFIHELTRALGSAATDMTFVVAVPDRLAHDELPNYGNLSWHALPDTNFVVWEQVLIPRLADKLNCAVIHFPYNTRALFTHGIRTVTTVHDVIFLTENIPGRRFKPWFVSQYAKQVFKHVTCRSDVVVSVSDTTRQALASIGLNAVTVYNTVDGFLAGSPTRRDAAVKPYILHRGGYLPHRNTERVIQAFLNARKRLPDMELHVIGAPQGAGRWNTRAEPSIRYLPRISDADLAACYVGSTCVVAASLEEGFGLPIIEGFGFGTPVITSDLDPMREVAGGAALLVDPFDVNALEEAMVSTVLNPAFRESLIKKGRDRLQVFGSERLAEQMTSIYTSCMK